MCLNWWKSSFFKSTGIRDLHIFLYDIFGFSHVTNFYFELLYDIKWGFQNNQMTLDEVLINNGTFPIWKRLLRSLSVQQLPSMWLLLVIIFQCYATTCLFLPTEILLSMVIAKEGNQEKPKSTGKYFLRNWRIDWLIILVAI